MKFVHRHGSKFVYFLRFLGVVNVTVLACFVEEKINQRLSIAMVK